MTSLSLTVTRRLFQWTALLTGVLCLNGCQAVHGYLDGMAKPSAHVVGTHLADLNLDSANLVFDVVVDNPYAAELPLSNLDYTLASGGKPFLIGQAPVQGTVPAKGSTTVSLPARLDFAKLLTALEGVKLGSVVPYDADLNLSANAPAIGKISLPLKKSGQLPVPAMPLVELGDVQWKGLDLNRGEALLHVNITNTNQFALDLTKLSLGLTLAGHSIANTAVEQPTSIAPGAQATIEIPIGFSPKDLGLSAFSLLQGKGSDYKIAGLLGANTPFGPLSFPYVKEGNTSFKSK